MSLSENRFHFRDMRQFRAEQCFERLSERHVDLRKTDGPPQIKQTGHAIARLRHSAWDDAAIVREVAIDVERDPVQAHPALDPDPDGGDLVLAPGP